MKDMKKKIFVLAVMTVLVSSIAAGTLAYFTDSTMGHNVITTGDVEIQLKETTDRTDQNGNPIDFEDVSGVMPGTEVSKIVQVENIGLSDAYVRVKVDTEIELLAGNTEKPDLGLVSVRYTTDNGDTMEYNTACWKKTDGYYYYLDKLEPGEITEPLITDVAFDTTMGNSYQGCTATVDVSAQATQAANNGSSALEAKGWPNGSRN